MAQPTRRVLALALVATELQLSIAAATGAARVSSPAFFRKSRRLEWADILTPLSTTTRSAYGGPRSFVRAAVGGFADRGWASTCVFGIAGVVSQSKVHTEYRQYDLPPRCVT